MTRFDDFRRDIVNPTGSNSAWNVNFWTIQSTQPLAASEAPPTRPKEDIMRPYWKGLYTADQLRHLLAAWGLQVPPPRRGAYIRLRFPGSVLDRGSVTMSPPSHRRGTYGNVLYRVVMWNSEAVARR